MLLRRGRLTIMSLCNKAPPFRIMAMLLLLASMGAVARTSDARADGPGRPAALIAQYENLNDGCAGGAGDTRKTITLCARRDALLTRIRARGWCWGHGAQIEANKRWERCDAHGPIDHAGELFLIAHAYALRDQLHQCANIAAAGDARLGKACETATRNAHNYLLALAKSSPVPDFVWATCWDDIQQDMALGARCITAAEDVCKLDATGDVTNRQQCLEVMGSDAWVVNPDAQALDFSLPVIP